MSRIIHVERQAEPVGTCACCGLRIKTAAYRISREFADGWGTKVVTMPYCLDCTRLVEDRAVEKTLLLNGEQVVRDTAVLGVPGGGEALQMEDATDGE